MSNCSSPRNKKNNKNKSRSKCRSRSQSRSPDKNKTNAPPAKFDPTDIKNQIPSSLVTLTEEEKLQLEDVLMRIGLKDCGL